jgi:RecA/RadA recombinase
MSLSDVIPVIEGMGARRVGDGKWKLRCPAHEDKTPSLDVTRGTGGKVLLICRAGCSVESVMSGLGLDMQALFDADGRDQAPRETLPPDRWPVTETYTYEDAGGDPVFRVQRHTSPDSGSKTFRQQRWTPGGWVSGMDGVKRVLYRLPRVLEALPGPVYVCEGERDVDALTSLGATATTNAGGAGKWDASFSTALRGRNVVILPDNDPPGEKHADLVKAALTGVAASVKVLRLPGLPPKGDVSDWLGEGGTLAQLDGLVARAEAGATFIASVSRLDGERVDRLANGRVVLKFGVKFLDEALGGITRRDLILVGAKTGAGKTQLASNIALANCRAGRRVHYFALEAEDREIERRMKFQAVAARYYREYAGSHVALRFVDWYSGRLDGILGRFESAADDDLKTVLKNLHTYYRVDSFTSDDFAKHLEAVREETDLVILDHFHYVDSEDTNENRAAKRTVKQIRDSALRAERPVIVVGHVRKSDPKFGPLIPTEEAFHGSSDIVKIATKAIMIAPDYATDTGERTLWSTYMQIVKCRQDSSLTRYVARIEFDTRTDSYKEHYVLGRLTEGGKAFVGLDRGAWPAWKEGENEIRSDV